MSSFDNDTFALSDYINKPREEDIPITTRLSNLLSGIDNKTIKVEKVDKRELMQKSIENTDKLNSFADTLDLNFGTQKESNTLNYTVAIKEDEDVFVPLKGEKRPETQINSIELSENTLVFGVEGIRKDNIIHSPNAGEIVLDLNQSYDFLKLNKQHDGRDINKQPNHRERQALEQLGNKNLANSSRVVNEDDLLSEVGLIDKVGNIVTKSRHQQRMDYIHQTEKLRNTDNNPQENTTFAQNKQNNNSFGGFGNGLNNINSSMRLKSQLGQSEDKDKDILNQEPTTPTRRKLVSLSKDNTEDIEDDLDGFGMTTISSRDTRNLKEDFNNIMKEMDNADKSIRDNLDNEEVLSVKSDKTSTLLNNLNKIQQELETGSLVETSISLDVDDIVESLNNEIKSTGKNSFVCSSIKFNREVKEKLKVYNIECAYVREKFIIYYTTIPKELIGYRKVQVKDLIGSFKRILLQVSERCKEIKDKNLDTPMEYVLADDNGIPLLTESEINKMLKLVENTFIFERQPNQLLIWGLR